MHENLHFLRRLSLLTRRVRGGGRFGEMLRKHYASQDRDMVLDDFDGTSEFHVNLSDHIGSQIFWHGHYSVDVLRIAAKLLQPSDVIFDVGANIGEFSVFAAKRAPQGRLHAFEPMEKLSATVRGNLEANHFRNAHVHQVGFSTGSADIPIYRTTSRGGDGAINNGLNSLYAGNGLDVAEIIKVVAMDEWCDQWKIAKLDLIKMDVEGAEMSALRGGADTIRRFKPAMIVEINPVICERAGYTPRDLVDYISSLGYSIFNIGRFGSTSVPLDLNSVSRDVLCMPK